MAEIVTLAETKKFLRVLHSLEDSIISLLIAAASDAVQDVATGWNGDGDAPDRIKLAVLARVEISYRDRGSAEAAKGELPMLTPLRTLET